MILARLRAAVEPSLFAAGFRFEGRNKSRAALPLPGLLPPKRIISIGLGPTRQRPLPGHYRRIPKRSEGYRPIAAVDLSGIAELPRQSQTTEVQLRIDAFVETVNGFLSKLAPPTYRDNL